ncbi:hypothetical protein K505DRAFT_362861 [Melanomma pulvis-pyrius CBS 109.77]|uniref:20S proteasome chaperone domain-containing protein n=1 Tax=Melanomma pulvis-pyrius CBS 109.77 TaxID=1314802 RepID=A0A6A6X870_9PLEO|nr:hypothetical protein K505DRAFT_362861 [Melanomma pulvis-pyrius CBS 109.77]
MAATLPNKEAPGTPIAVSFPLPRAPQTEIHVQLINTGASLLVFLTTTTPTPSTAAPLGSFVYAMPNRSSPANPLSTPLYNYDATVDFATRLAKVLARKADKPVYVGNSIGFASAGMGGTVEEQMEGFRRCVEVVVGLLEREKESST